MSGGRGYHNVNGNYVGNIGQTRISSVPMVNSKGVVHQPQYNNQQQQPRRISMQAAAVNAGTQSQQQQQAHKVYVTSSQVAKPMMPAPPPPPPKGSGKKGKMGAPAVPGTSRGGQLSAAGGGAPKQRRKAVKLNKGLRHFSLKVCEKVKEKGKTTYNEVADELVGDELRRVEPGDRSFDQKNIRRRVYDALNVLMAMNIIAKEKKEIRWLGLPNNTPAKNATMDSEIVAKRAAVAAKEKELKDLLLLQVSLKNLVNRNRESEEMGYIPTPNSHIQLPFIVVNTHRDTRINCTISQDKTEYFFKFDDKFELNDHVTVLQRMGLLMGLDTGTSSEADIAKLKQLVPYEFQGLIEDYGRGKTTVEVPEEALVADQEEEVEEEIDEMVEMEYMDVNSLADQDIEEEYSEDDTIIEEGY